MESNLSRSEVEEGDDPGKGMTAAGINSTATWILHLDATAAGAIFANRWEGEAGACT
jgi:hypothetical protein